MNKLKYFVSLLLIVLISFSSIHLTSYAETADFTDVPSSHWAYDNIKLMSNLGIINGYDDNTFLPNKTILRSEFSKMMVLTLDLDLKYPKTSFFNDVKTSDWFFPYVETAKNYLTGFKSGEKNYFKPTLEAVREDIAVAMVLGLGLEANTNNSILDDFSDKDTISKNLAPYVATAIDKGIMIGNSGKFKGQGLLTRAEAATLLSRLIKEEKIVTDEEKVVYDKEKIIYDKKLTLSTSTEDDKIILKWNSLPSENFKYYKIVASQLDSTPKYPENGYIKYLANSNSNKTEIYPHDKINGGDTSKLIPGEKYYISVTAVYNNKSYTSNVKYLKIPKAKTEEKDDVKDEYEEKKYDNDENYEDDYENRTPILEITKNNGKLKLNWTECSDDDFVYYKLVFSKKDSSPSYPENGYLTYINNYSTTEYFVENNSKYHGGDIDSKLISGEKYYIAVTAVYKDANKYYNSNIITTILP